MRRSCEHKKHTTNPRQYRKCGGNIKKQQTKYFKKKLLTKKQKTGKKRRPSQKTHRQSSKLINKLRYSKKKRAGTKRKRGLTIEVSADFNTTDELTDDSITFTNKKQIS